MGFDKVYNSNKKTQFSKFRNPADVLSHLSFKDLGNYIRAHGTGCEIKKAIICPCMKNDTGQPSINCGVCRSTGWAYIGNVNGSITGEGCPEKPVKIIMGSRGHNKSYNRPGGYIQTGKTPAVLFYYMPASGDLVRPNVDLEVINDEFHIRGHIYANGKSSEFLLMEKVKQVEGIFTINADKTEIVEYVQGTDYSVINRVI